MSLSQESIDRHWMRYALLLAERARALDEVPVGAVIVRDGQVIGEGWNQPISAHDPTAHAEVIAIRDASLRSGNYRLVGATLYVTIEPCTMCAGALVHARIERLVYGASEPKAGAIVSASQVLDNPRMNYRISHQGAVLEEVCAAGISRFFADRRASKRLVRKQRQLSAD